LLNILDVAMVTSLDNLLLISERLPVKKVAKVQLDSIRFSTHGSISVEYFKAWKTNSKDCWVTAN